MQLCPNCGRERADGDIICVYCGHATTMPASAARPLTPAPVPAPAARPAPAPPPFTIPSSQRDVVTEAIRAETEADAARTLAQAVAAIDEFQQPVAAPAPAHADVSPSRKKSTSRKIAVAAAASVV